MKRWRGNGKKDSRAGGGWEMKSREHRYGVLRCLSVCLSDCTIHLAIDACSPCERDFETLGLASPLSNVNAFGLENEV